MAYDTIDLHGYTVDQAVGYGSEESIVGIRARETWERGAEFLCMIHGYSSAGRPGITGPIGCALRAALREGAWSQWLYKSSGKNTYNIGYTTIRIKPNPNPIDAPLSRLPAPIYGAESSISLPYEERLKDDLENGLVADRIAAVNEYGKQGTSEAIKLLYERYPRETNELREYIASWLAKCSEGRKFLGQIVENQNASKPMRKTARRYLNLREKA